MHPYVLYGLSLQSAWALPCRESCEPRLPAVELCEGPAGLFAAARREFEERSPASRWAGYFPVSGGAEYLRWPRLFEFLVSADGHRIVGRALEDGTPEAFHTYLLGQVLSHALIKLGAEPLHATVVEIDGEAVGFMGDSGYGKTTLAAAFLRAGARLVTDDLLIVQKGARGIGACPGLPRIKLFPRMADRLLDGARRGTPMNPLTSKRVIPLGSAQCVDHAVPLRRLYVLPPPEAGSKRRRVSVRRLSPRRAFVELMRNTYNADVVHRRRLERQLPLHAEIALNVPMKSLSFPRTLSCLSDVRAAVLSDLQQTVRP